MYLMKETKYINKMVEPHLNLSKQKLKIHTKK